MLVGQPNAAWVLFGDLGWGADSEAVTKLPMELSRAGGYVGVSCSGMAAGFSVLVSFGVMEDPRGEALIQHHRYQGRKLLQCGL